VTLRSDAIDSVRWTSLSSVARIGLSFLQVAIVARLLPPGDFGLMAVAMALIAFLEVFADLGVSNAIIHFKEEDANRLSSLYWLNVVAGASVALVLLLASPLLAAFYGEPLLQPMLGLAALYLLISASWQQLLVRAEKDFRFGELAVVQVTASVAGLVVTVAVASNGGGVFALVCGLLVQGIAGAGLGWWMLSRGWRPRWRLRPSEIGQYLRFGAYAVGNNLTNAVSSQFDLLLGGNVLGAKALGEYSVSKNLCLQVAAALNPVVTRVGLPLMARAQDDRTLLKTIYLQTIRMTASANFPLHVAIALFAPEIVRLLLGSQWDSAVPLVRLLALWALIRSTLNPVGSLLMACGRADLSFRWNVALMLVTAPVVWAGSQHGQAGLAGALTILIAAALVPHWYFLVRPLCGATLAEYVRAVSLPFGVSAAAGLLAYAATQAFDGALLRLAVGMVAGAVAYVALSRVFNPACIDAVLALIRRR
jgi:O-antigen/teichoic acid export membrane protein